MFLLCIFYDTVSDEGIDSATTEMNSSSLNGISIEDALSILSVRKPNQHQDRVSIGESMKQMGQSINLFGKALFDKEQDKEKMENEKRQVDRKERYQKVQNELHNMTEKELLHGK